MGIEVKINMVTTDFQRGHKIYYNEYKKEWRYVHDDSPAKIEKRCIRCLKYPLKDGEDYCLGHMEGVKSACCGHGVEKGFIILNDGRRFEEVINDD